MKFLGYIKGKRKSREAHRIERDSMQDPFLYEAIEGFDSIDDNHIRRISNIQARIRAKSQSVKKGYGRAWQTAAAIFIITFGIGGYFLNNSHKSNLYAQKTIKSRIIDIYVPDIYYSENIVPIAKTNARVAREAYKPEISKFKINEDINLLLLKEDSAIFSEGKKGDKREMVIEIYIPKN